MGAGIDKLLLGFFRSRGLDGSCVGVDEYLGFGGSEFSEARATGFLEMGAGVVEFVLSLFRGGTPDESGVTVFTEPFFGIFAEWSTLYSCGG
jgi:hypothetical protein